VEFEEKRLAGAKTLKALIAGRTPEVDFVQLFGGQVGEPGVVGDGYIEAHGREQLAIGKGEWFRIAGCGIFG